MIEVNETLTRNVAKLARLKLTEEEATRFTAQLGQIIGYVDQLSAIDTKGVEPLAQAIEFEPRYREDQTEMPPRDEHDKPAVLKSAPEVLYDGFKVPPIL